jgi:hypothetical protein
MLNAYLTNWLRAFGHVQSSDDPKLNYSQAIASAQHFLGIEPTGQLCRATERAMLSPRCGCRDRYDDGDRKAVQGLADLQSVNKWPTGDINYAFLDYLPESLITKPDQLAIIRDNWDIVASICGLRATLIDDVANAHVVYNTGRGARGGFDTPAVLGYTYEPTDNTPLAYRNAGVHAAAGEVVFDIDELWTKDKQDARRIPYMMVSWHEGCGHGLGLGHVAPQAEPNMMEAVLDRNALEPGPWDREQLVLRYGPPRSSAPTTSPASNIPAGNPAYPPASKPGLVNFKIQEANGLVRQFMGATEVFPQ